jgi:hypothetical protein
MFVKHKNELSNTFHLFKFFKVDVTLVLERPFQKLDEIAVLIESFFDRPFSKIDWIINESWLTLPFFATWPLFISLSKGYKIKKNIWSKMHWMYYEKYQMS